LLLKKSVINGRNLKANLIWNLNLSEILPVYSKFIVDFTQLNVFLKTV